MARILIVDDYQPFASALEETITSFGHEVDIAHSISTAICLAKVNCFELIFLDVCLPDGSGLDYLPDLRQTPGKPDIIIITASKDMKGANLALENGAWDYLCKPFDMNEARLQLERVLQYRSQTQTPVVCKALKRHRIIGSSSQLNMSLDRVAQTATTTVNTLVTGETGTGKELFAKAIHENSARADHPFVVLDCSVLPEHLVESTLFGYEKGAFTGAENTKPGLIQLADRGTLFIDEIGDLSPESQKIFLRVLQEKSYRPLGAGKEYTSNFRLVSATNRDLEKMAREKKFRTDLLFRLKGFSIDLPPLRERLADIMDIILYHLAKICTQNKMETKGISPDFVAALEVYDWPGNVRELVNTVDRAVAAAANSPVLFPVHLPGEIRIKALEQKIFNTSQPSLSDPVQSNHFAHGDTGFLLLKDARKIAISDFEARYLEALYFQSGGDLKTACRVSGLKRTRLWELYKKHGIKKNNSRSKGSMPFGNWAESSL